MSQPSRDQYLESKVFTASQPQLHMMLLDGAIRFGKQAKEAWANESGTALGDQSLERMFDIVEELLQGLASGEGETSDQLAEQYAFVYRELSACRVNQDASKLDSCLNLLAYQRETWKLAVERVDTEHSTPVPTMPHVSIDTAQTPSGFSFEA
ncbi:MAG: flagellar export chaperone FliS [Planctomycetota bacterium]